MGWLDKLLGRDKKKDSEMTGEGSMKSEGTGQEQGGMGAQTPGSPDQPAQEGQEPPSTP
jgi:hypothetical protein